MERGLSAAGQPGAGRRGVSAAPGRRTSLSAPARAQCSWTSAAKARRAIERLIDSYTEELIDKSEFEPRLAELRRRTARLEAEAKAQQEADEQIRSLHLVIGKLELFAAMMRERLANADWATKRDIICTLVKRIEVADDVVRVVFRIDPGSSGTPATGRTLHHCPIRRGAVALPRQRYCAGGCGGQSVTQKP